MDKKKVLFVSPSLTSGGSERVMAILANEIAKKYDVELCLVRDKKDTYEVNEYVNVVRYQRKSNNKIINILKRIKFIRKEIKKNDYVISFMFDINFMTLIASIFLRKKVIVSERAYPKLENKVNIMIPILRYTLYTLAYRVVFQTEEASECFPKYIKKKSVVIPNPISSSLPVREKKQINNNIVAAGRFTKQKNFEMLIEAFADFNKIHDNYKLIIYGDGRLRNVYEDKIKSLNLTNKVELPGYISDVNDKMKNCKVYVSTSNFEGISNSMLEAMAMGIPSVCTDCPVGGARLAIKNNVNGILTEVGNKEDITKALCKLVEDKDFYDKISLNALKINKTFSINKIVDKWLNLF